jgi:DNA-directed RNA polymerase specialized sigma24 family protein
MTQLAGELVLEQCRAAVARLCERYGWRLLDRATWVERACRHLKIGTTTEPSSAAFYTYSEALHRACSGDEGSQRQEQGYAELGAFLDQIASRCYPDVSADATQLALFNIYRSFKQCEQPGWFFAFAKYRLKDAARTIRVHEQRQQALTTHHIDHSPLCDELAGPRQDEPSAAILADEDRAMLERYRADFLRKHPRAERQFDAIWLKYIVGLSDGEISARLGVTINDVYTLRCRGIKKLQEDRAWRALAAEFGIFPDEA